MSDSAPVVSESAPASSESAPSSSSDIAASVISQAESSDTSGSGEGESRIDTTNTVEAKPDAPPTQAELSAAMQFLQKMGHKPTGADGRPTWLKVSTVEKMLDSYLGQHRTTWDTEKGSLQSRAQQLETFFSDFQNGIKGDPRALIEEIAGLDPRYKSFLTPAEQQQQQMQQAQDPRPKPDLELADGGWTYSPEGVDKLLEWKSRQLEARLETKLKPLMDREEQERQRQQADQMRQSLETKTRSMLEDAKTWPGFADHENDILKALQDDTAKARAEGRRPSLSLDAAYRQVVIAKLATDRTSMRSEVIKELNSAPKSTATTPRAVDAPRQQGPRSSADIVRQVIAQAEQGA
jgi:hypothetical protein